MTVPLLPTSAPKPSETYVQSFARGLAVIRSFGAGSPSQTLSEVAACTGLTRADARRILLTLEGLGYVGPAKRGSSASPRAPWTSASPTCRRCRCGILPSR